MIKDVALIHRVVQFSSRWYLYAWKSPYAPSPPPPPPPPPVSQKFPQRCRWNVCNVLLIDDGPLSSYLGGSFSASSFNASLLQAINGVVSLALCPQVLSQVPQHFRSSEKQATYEGFFTRQAICSVASLHAGISFPFTPACPGQYTHREF